MKKDITQIVLLGGGYVSIWAYRSLVSNLRHQIARGLVQITVVCPEDHHFFHGWTAECLTCIIQDKNRMSSLAEVLPKAHLVKGVADEIDAQRKIVRVHMKDGTNQVLHFDHLLIGIGSHDSHEVEGTKKFGWLVKSHESFLRTKARIQSIVREAAAEPQIAHRLLSFTVAGSGFSGVELATNIAEFVDVLKKDYPSLKNFKPLIRLINSGENILRELNPRFRRMRKYAEKTMTEYGIELINNQRVAEINAEGALLTDGSFLQSSMVISTVGQSRMLLKGTENMEKDFRERLCTNAFLQVGGQTNIWGGGDACHVKNYQNMEYCPSNALWAIKHGEFAGRNIARSIKGKTLSPFAYRGLGQCASLGVGKGMGELYGVQFTGWIAWIMRWIVFNYFIPSRKVMMGELADWFFLMVHGKRRGLKASAKQFNANRGKKLRPAKTAQFSYHVVQTNHQHLKNIKGSH